MGLYGHNRNLMEELRDIICEIERRKPEPEVCNIRCPPLGCPQGPCPGMCCSDRICDPCCVSRMPCYPPPPPRPPPCSFNDNRVPCIDDGICNGLKDRVTFLVASRNQGTCNSMIPCAQKRNDC